ncbi:MAG: hypothetical protein PHH70_04725 [Candidatus Gracilibacteria bacterium]|nr:hypothetical protein [Candidatus Gracilibacteria bacterium]
MRIYITGPGGAGKSTLAKQLGAHYSIPVTHLDELQWGIDMVEKEEYRALRAAIIAEENWIIEGSSPSVLKAMKDCVDVVIVLNYSPIGNIFRILKRHVKSVFFGEKRIGWSLDGVHELRLGFLFKTLRWRTRQLPRIRQNIMECALEGKVIEIDSIEGVFEKVVTRM